MRTIYLLTSVISAALPTAAGLRLNVTALGAANGASTLACWQMDTPFSVATAAGIAGSATLRLGSVADLVYTVIPAGFDGGLHNAPYNQWVVFTSGLAYITLPTDETTEAYIFGGEFGVIFASDIANVSAQGHRTQYPGLEETTAFTIPTDGNVVPAHQVLHSGPCTVGEILGLRGLANGAS